MKPCFLHDEVEDSLVQVFHHLVFGELRLFRQVLTHLWVLDYCNSHLRLDLAGDFVESVEQGDKRIHSLGVWI